MQPCCRVGTKADAIHITQGLMDFKKVKLKDCIPWPGREKRFALSCLPMRQELGESAEMT